MPDSFELNDHRLNYMSAMSSSAHTYGNLLATAQKWVLDIFPNNLLYDECVGYNITYYDEQEYNERELILKKYNEEAYIELTKKIYPALKQGIFLGQIISSDNKEKLYKISLPSTPNNLIMLYKVDNKIGKIILYKLSKINITIEYINDFL